MNTPCRRRAIYAQRAKDAAQAAANAKETHREEVQEEAQAAPVLKACPRCGKVMQRVSYMHTKHCKG